MSSELDNRRQELLDLNTKAWNGEYSYKVAAKLDSSLKKNTTFIKKIKTGVNQDQYKFVLKDIETVSIEKYLSEVIVNLVEALCKVSKSDDISAAIEIVSALHQRFAGLFSTSLLVHVLVNISNPNRSQQNEIDEKEEAARIIRQRNLLKLVGEFYIIGIFRVLKDCNKDLIPHELLVKFGKQASEPILIVVIKDLMNFELQSGNSLGVVHSFVKRFQHIICNNNNELLSNEVRNVLLQIFTIYSKAVFDITMNLKKRVKQVAERNSKASIRTGRILEEIQIELDNFKASYEKFKSTSEFLSVTFDIPPLNWNLDQDDTKQASVVEVVKAKSLNEDDLNGVWEDIKEKNFYTIIPSLGEIMDSDAIEHTRSVSSKDGEKIQDFLNRLEDVGANNLEQLVVEFNNLNLNNKATKNRIMRFFIETSSISNLKYYTRFLKINEINLSDLIQDLILYLDKGFRHQLYQNKLNFKNILFFVEMIKFKMVPIHLIFHKIRTLTLNITSTNNIDILVVFYENVGRFLLNEPEYKDLMMEMIELLKEQSKKSNLKINDKLAINNLLLIVNPPANTKVKREKSTLSLKSQFVQRLIRVELDSKSVPVVIKLLQKIPVHTDEECCKTVLDCFAHPELLNYDNIPALAEVLEMYAKTHKKIVVYTIDTLIENIMRGLELNDYRMNRVRMSQIKLMAELYNNKIIQFKLLNDLLYRILCSGHPNNQPMPNNWDVEIDLPDNYFRIQLCCLLLLSIKSITVDTDFSLKKKSPAKQAFDVKKRTEINKELLGVFTTFLQYYLFCKQSPLPVELQFKLADLFAKYEDIPKVKRYDTLREIVQKLQESIQTKKDVELQLMDEDDDEESVLVDEELDEDEFNEREDEDDTEDEDEEDDDEESSDDEEENDDEDEEEESDMDNELSEPERIRLEEAKRFSDDIDKEFQKIMIESYNISSRPQQAPKSKLSMPLPRQVVIANEIKKNGNDSSKVSFGLLTRNGKKTNVKQLNLPSDNKFAESILKEQEDQRQDRQKIMNLVLQMDD
ncbi:Nonsense-mediated mRNA decay protein 2 [Spathaspora sp. JA1]|nr:Nonsense-mediated mRNA decay protein 2 [Spathaspora sp. JA1]